MVEGLVGPRSASRVFFSHGGTVKKEEKEKEEKFPPCVKAKVIGPFRAAAQKETKN